MVFDRRENDKRYRENNREKLRIKNMIFYVKNRERLIEKEKSEYNKKYREKNKEELSLYNENYYKKNKVRILEKLRKCRVEEKIRRLVNNGS